jgi:AcrR family transcriptional regulator
MPRSLSEQDIADFRDRLCDAGEQLFADHGPDAVTIRQLAAELGVSAMTPYRYFKDKDAILAAVRARAFDRFAQAMESAHHDDPEQYAYPGQAYVEWALTHPHAYKLMYDVNQPTFAEHPDLLKAMDRARATMSAGLQDEPKLKGVDITLMAHALWAAMHGPIMLQLAGLLGPKTDAETLLKISLPRLVDGFKATPLLEKQP